MSCPVDIAWELARSWPDSELVLIDDAGHGAREAGTIEALVTATDRYAAR